MVAFSRVTALQVAVILVSMLVANLFLASVVAPGAQAAAPPSRYLKVVQLGDSYSAGNGASNTYELPACYRSAANWGSRYATFLSRQPPTAAYSGTSVNYVNSACHGGVMADISAAKGTRPPQINAVAGAISWS